MIGQLGDCGKEVGASFDRDRDQLGNGLVHMQVSIALEQIRVGRRKVGGDIGIVL